MLRATRPEMPPAMAETLDLRRAVMRCGECGQRFGADATFCPFDGAKLQAAAWDPTGDPLLRRVIDGRYEIVGVLGEGGMGTVYQVRHTSLDRLFAMKVLRRDLASDPDLAARFMREARATASVKHPNIGVINDFGRIEVGGAEVPYFVMENLVGQTLAHAIKAGGALPTALGVRIVLKVAGALAAAHAERIVHRDLKPDNIFVLGSAAGAAAVDVRVVDFGAALILGASRVTKAGVVFGTPHYMSPEQASGQPVDHRADIYALGVIMYEMFTGRVPFVADTYMGVLTQHMFVKPVPPSLLKDAQEERPGQDAQAPSERRLGAVEAIILRALEKKPEHRYGTMHDLAADLERASALEPDGSLRVAPPLDAAAPARAGVANVPTLSLDSHPASTDELEATKASTRSRRARARAWAIYGAIVLGAATLTLVAVRALQRSHEAPAAAAVPSPVSSAEPYLAASLAAAPPIAPAPPLPAASATPPPVAIVSVPNAASARSASRAPHASASPAKKPAAPAPRPGDFADPWAK
jgi:serine/threonine protein kinase